MVKRRYNEYRRTILEIQHFNDNEITHQTIINFKNDIIKRGIYFINPDYAYSPFLLDDYCIASISKFILSPNLS